MTTTQANTRLTFLDIYRGFVMFLMMAEVLKFREVSEKLPGSQFWQFLAHQQSHVEWRGCVLHDLIQPSFSFLVGVVLPYSIAGRLAKGDRFSAMFRHAIKRSLALIVLGILLRSQWRSQTYFTFEDTLSQIGLGYPILFLLGFRNKKVQINSLIIILVGYFVAFALYTPTQDGLNYYQPGVPAGWEENATGFAAHWNKNANLAWRFDAWFLNLFPREKAFLFNGGGYATLSFIPTLGTMILGLLAGNYLKENKGHAATLKTFLLAGIIGIVSGSILDSAGICPNVKRIWTPTWVLYSGGWCFLIMSVFYWMMEVMKWHKPFTWLVVIGTNSIVAYVMADTSTAYFTGFFRTHIGEQNLTVWSAQYKPFAEGLLVLIVEWLILYWLYRKKIFIRI